MSDGFDHASQTKAQIKRVINTSGHKSKFASVGVYTIPTIKDKHLALLHNSVTQEGRSLCREILVMLAGSLKQDFRPCSWELVGSGGCQRVSKMMTMAELCGGLRPWSLSRDLCSPLCGQCPRQRCSCQARESLSVHSESNHCSSFAQCLQTTDEIPHIYNSTE